MVMINELGATIESIAGEVPRRPILVVEYAVGMSIQDGKEVPNSELARRIIEALGKEKEASCSGLAIPVEIDWMGKVVTSWSILKSPGWRVYELRPPDASQTKEEGVT